MKVNMDDMRLDRRAYQGAPQIRNGHWPDDFDLRQPPHWSWDKAQVISGDATQNQATVNSRFDVIWTNTM
jgi:hypothetical protein